MTPPAPTPEDQAAAAVLLGMLLLGMLDQDTLNWREVSDAITKALATAHARGRAEGLEAAAQGAESWEPEWQITVQEAFVRQEIAAALRALRRPPSPREEGNRTQWR